MTKLRVDHILYYYSSWCDYWKWAVQYREINILLVTLINNCTQCLLEEHYRFCVSCDLFVLEEEKKHRNKQEQKWQNSQLQR